MYKVLRFFTDLQDNDYAYNEGDIYPREGLIVTQDRLKELSSKKNKRGLPLIEALPFTEDIKEEAKEEPKEEKPKPKRTRKKG
jgi:hypothetical protein